MKRILLFITLLFLVKSLVAQDDVKISRSEFVIKGKPGLSQAMKDIRYGDYFYNKKTKGTYGKALEYYLKAYEYNPDNPALNYKIGISYLYSFSKKKSLEYLQKAYNENPKVADDILYNLAQAYQYNYKFDKAIELFRQFTKTQKYKKSDFYRFMVNKKIVECNNAKELIKDSINVVITDMSELNSKYEDYGPVITADGEKIYFTSRRPNADNMIDPNDGQYYEDIYKSDKDQGYWQTPKNVGKPLNSPTHDAVVGLSHDGQTMIIYRDGDLYWSKLQGKEWSWPKPFPKVINTDQVESSACFSLDGNTLYFVRGKRPDPLKSNGDIYYSIKDDKGKWSKPVKMPENVNTPYDEDGLYMHPDGRTLYFSSKGHNSMGGYDIFKTVLQDDGTWSDPVNIGYPVNTPDDDIYFVLSGDGKTGYYSAAREDTKGSTDLYVINFRIYKPKLVTEDNLLAGIAQPVKETSVEPGIKITLVKGKVLDKNGKPVEATIEIIDNETGKVIYRAKTNSVTGEYLVSLPAGKNYAMVIRKEGYLFHSENFDLVDEQTYNEVKKDLVIQEIAPESKAELHNIFFDYNSDRLKPESYPELDRLVEFLKKNPSIEIEVSGHTDNIGSYDYNLQLSYRRALAVVNYLVNKGIDRGRLIARGYGSSKPIATNDTPEGRARNRRVEVKIINKQ